MIHAAGDGHNRIFLDDQRVNMMQEIPCTAYQLMQPLSKLGAGQKIARWALDEMAEGDILLLSAGEIDCRIHIWKARHEQSRTLFNIVNETVDRLSIYCNALALLGIKVIVLGIPPPGWEPNIYGYNIYATPDEHVRIYGVFHSRCVEYKWGANVGYLPMYDKFVGPDGHVAKEWVNKDNVHLKAEAKEHVFHELAEFGFR